MLRSRAVGKAPTTWVFSGSAVPLNRPHSANNWFQQTMSHSVAKGLIPERVILHDLRHTAALLMVSAGSNIKPIQRQLRHASAAMTLDVSTELF
ncbi:tyrosine-type recombinase/integrase [Corynebacterium confusum]|uniref:tyrosine-type recombinase/integrase n=1 Tax=uncultured Corynebacterium sp. TaxID=159447 RepID=UPI0025EFEC99|nr:tyrosine-type recombinase/integrase [uncultured Corynebacterium sp.]